jgi:hypothetical protein
MRSAESAARKTVASLLARDTLAARSSRNTMPSTTGHFSFSTSARDVIIVLKASRRQLLLQLNDLAASNLEANQHNH